MTFRRAFFCFFPGNSRKFPKSSCLFPQTFENQIQNNFIFPFFPVFSRGIMSRNANLWSVATLIVELKIKKMYKDDTPIWQLNVKELVELINIQLNETNTRSDNIKKIPKRYVYGIPGLAELFHCSTTTANRIKKSGVIKNAICQVGKKIIVDADLALQLINNQQERRIK